MSALPAGETNEAVDRVLSKTKEVAVLPQVVYKIMETTSSEDSSSAMLEEAIVIDAAIETLPSHGEIVANNILIHANAVILARHPETVFRGGGVDLN